MSHMSKAETAFEDSLANGINYFAKDRKSPLFSKDTVVLTRDGKTRGLCTGAQYRCQLAGCTGLRIVVRWPDARCTRPCSKGLTWDKRHKAWRIA
uniref:Uncharacterized protein n=1 Tax=viral metagenome TaxID=1070528 RepID=A0A6H1ZUX7_9ZZZZ